MSGFSVFDFSIFFRSFSFSFSAFFSALSRSFSALSLAFSAFGSRGASFSDDISGFSECSGHRSSFSESGLDEIPWFSTFDFSVVLETSLICFFLTCRF